MYRPGPKRWIPCIGNGVASGVVIIGSPGNRMGPEISIYLEPYNAVYVEVPKVACSSIKACLAELLGVELRDGNPHITNFPTLNISSRGDSLWYPEQFSFAFARNPWDRLVSCYRDKILGDVKGFTSFDIKPGVANCLAGFDEFIPGMGFEAFVHAVCSISDADADEHFRSQYTFVAHPSKTLALSFVGRYETLAEDLKQIEARAGLPPLNLPRLQAASSKAVYQDYYPTHSLREAVALRFKSDIELFGYEF